MVLFTRVTVRFLFNFINYFCVETHPTSRYELIFDFMVRTALTVHEILSNMCHIYSYEFILDFMVRNASAVIIKYYHEMLMKYF